jgi:hypothetical protein
VEVSEKDGEGEEHDIRGFTHEQAHKLDNLGPHHECELNVETIHLAIARYVSESSQGQQDDDRVEGKRERGKGGDVQGVGAPTLLTWQRISKIRLCGLDHLPPDISFGDKTCVVASPVASCPT